MAGEAGVLLMAYGSPGSLDELEPYYTDIRGGRPPSPEALDELAGRYRRIGGLSPLTEITRRQAQALENALIDGPTGCVTVYVGMKHWHPFVHETVTAIAADGIQTLAGIVLAPHYSKMSIGGYEQRLLSARQAQGVSFNVRMVRSWYDDPAFVDFLAARLRNCMAGWDPAEEGTRVFFTAHSLPERILRDADPYRDELLASCELVCDRAGVPHWEFAFQSASRTGEPWLGPDILERLAAFGQEGGGRALVAPIGFVADHLEVLFDIDVECAELTAALGIEMRRLPSPNDDPEFIEVLAGVARRALAHGPPLP